MPSRQRWHLNARERATHSVWLPPPRKNSSPDNFLQPEGSLGRAPYTPRMSADALHAFLWGAAFIPGFVFFFRYRRRLYVPSQIQIPARLGSIWIVCAVGVALWGLLCWLMFDVWR